MNTADLVLIAALAVSGALVGAVVRRRVATLSYRRDDEASRPAPGSRWWIVLAATLASGVLGWRFDVERWPLLLPTLPVAWFGPWLSAIDLDVRRLPNRILAAHAVLVVLGVAAAALITQDPGIAIQAAIAAAVAFAVFWILDLLRPGGHGWGDGKYAPILSAATGAVSLTTAWWAFLLACLAAIAATPFRRTRSFPFGPWLWAGAIAALVVFA